MPQTLVIWKTLLVCLVRFRAVLVACQWGNTFSVAVGTVVSAGDLGSERAWKLKKQARADFLILNENL